MVLELDADNRRLALGHKQLEENPWDTFESIFELGSVHRCTLLSKGDKFATLELPYGIEGIATLKNIAKEDGSMPEVGESLDCMVLEFSKDEKKIVLSHTKVWQGGTVEEKAPKKSSAKATESAPAKDTKEGDKSTFGDLDVLSALKEQMEDTEKKEKKSAKEADKAVAVKEEKAEKEEKEAE